MNDEHIKPKSAITRMQKNYKDGNGNWTYLLIEFPSGEIIWRAHEDDPLWKPGMKEKAIQNLGYRRRNDMTLTSIRRQKQINDEFEPLMEMAKKVFVPEDEIEEFMKTWMEDVVDFKYIDNNPQHDKHYNYIYVMVNDPLEFLTQNDIDRMREIPDEKIPICYYVFSAKRPHLPQPPRKTKWDLAIEAITLPGYPKPADFDDNEEIY